MKSAKRVIPDAMLETLVHHAFKTRGVHWWNSLFIGFPDTTILKIQTVHNTCAKFLSGGKRFDSATEKLKALAYTGYLFKYRIKYKMLKIAREITNPADMCNTPDY